MHNRFRVLVVDDDPLFRNLLTTLLRQQFFVTVASDGHEAFYAALESPPDAAIIDVQMPKWDGLQTLKAFRNHPALQNVRTMMLTSDASRETVLAAISEGADDYLVKTRFSRDELLQKLSRLLPCPEPAEDEPEAAGDWCANECPPIPAGLRSPAAVTTAGIDEDAALQSLFDSWE